MTVQPIILAGGKGTRMNNPDLPKVLTAMAGGTIIGQLLPRLEKAGLPKPALVVGYHREKVKQALGDSYIYVDQDEQLGTGHAVLVCEPQLAGSADAYLVMYGDHPLWSPETLQNMVAEHQRSGAVMTLATVKSDHPTLQSYGRIIRDAEGEIQAIREQKDCTPEEAEILERNPGLYCFSDSWLWPALHKIGHQNAQGEYYLTDLLEIAIAEKQKIASVTISRWQETLGVNNLEQLKDAEQWV